MTLKKPKYVYVVVSIHSKGMQINGCFYDKEAAKKYAGVSSNVVVQKLGVI